MKNILIIGANSFIGQYFIDNTSDCIVNEFDIQNGVVSDIDFSNVDVVFHVAAIVHQDKSIDDDLYYAVNRDLAFDVAKMAKEAGVSQFVFMSTVKVYGENSTEANPWTEFSECHPQDAYGKSKLEAREKLVSLSDDDFCMTIVRTPVVYGQAVKGNIRRLANLVKSYKYIPLGGIDNKRAMVYVGNLIALIQRTIEMRYDGVVLASDPTTISTSTLVKYLAKASPRNNVIISFPKILQVACRYIKPTLYNRLFGSMVVDNSYTCSQLDFVPPYETEKAIGEVMKSL